MAIHRESMEQVGEIARETEQRLCNAPGTVYQSRQPQFTPPMKWLNAALQN